MDFHTLLSVANNNQVEAVHELSQKRYSTEFAPAKKQPKSNVQSKQVQLFLARKAQEEREKANIERKKKEQLLELRAQNSKNNKKAKIMASRTKDNDFSRIKMMTEDEQEAHQKLERELQALALKDKRDRMKARIELEEKEKLLPRKRKRKNKLSSEPDKESHPTDTHTDDHDDFEAPKTDKMHSKGQNTIRKKPPPPSSSLNFHELLKIAAEKQHQPLVLPKVEKVDDRPLSKKGKRLMQEEEERARRKLAGATKSSNSRTNPSVKSADSDNQGNLSNSNRKSNSSNEHNKAKLGKNVISQSSGRTNPTVIQVQKAETSVKPKAELSKKSGISHSKQNLQRSENISANRSQAPSSFVNRPQVPNSSTSKSQPPTNHPQQRTNVANGFKKDKPGLQKTNQVQSIPQKKSKADPEIRTKSSGTKPSKGKSSSTDQNSNACSNFGNILSEDMMAQITNQIREKIQKELEEKLFKQALSKTEDISPQNQKPKKEPVPSQTGNSIKKSASAACPRVESGKMAMPPPRGVPQKKIISAVKRDSMPPPPKKMPPKAFHPNPYLLPPRRLLESTRPPKRPIKRRLESDDEDEDEDDDMDGFIDNSSSNQEDYSKYIQEIFNYDRSRYADMDDDDIQESSFAQVDQEEVRSAKIGFLEDLEEEKKEKEEMRRKAMKKRKK